MITMLDPKTLTVLITGATAGLGAAFARRFAEAGSRVIGTGRRAERLDALQRELGERCHTAVVDVRDRKAVEGFVAGLPAPFASINVAVANAGLALGLEPAHKVELDDWEDMVATNINGLRASGAARHGRARRGPHRADRFRGRRLPVSRRQRLRRDQGVREAVGLNLRADLLGSSVRVTNIEPGMTETEFALVRFKGDAAKAAAPYRGVHPMSAEEVAESVFWSCMLPRHVNINRLQLMPVQQAFGPFAFHRT